ARSRTTGKSFPQLSANARSEAERAGTSDSLGEDLTADYHDLAVAVQGLGFLESGITDQLNHFSNTLLEFSALLRHTVRSLEVFWANHRLTRLQTQNTTDPFLVHLHSLLAYSHAHRAVLKLRDQKQLDLEVGIGTGIANPCGSGVRVFRGTGTGQPKLTR